MESYPADFISGVIAMGYLLVGSFFLKFWLRTRDGLFLIFAIAFWLLTVNRAIFPLTSVDRSEGWVYLLRLAAFLLIIVAMVRKNLQASGR